MSDLLDLLPPEFPLPDSAHTGVKLAEEHADEWWLRCALTGIGYYASLGDPFTADDVRRLGVPEPDHANRWGAAFRRAQADGVIVATGNAKPSTTGSRRGGLLREWRGAA